MSSRKKSRNQPVKTETKPILPLITDPDLLDDEYDSQEECQTKKDSSDPRGKTPQTDKPKGWMTTIYENKLLILIGFLVILIIVIIAFLVLRKVDDPQHPPDNVYQQRNIPQQPPPAYADRFPHEYHAQQRPQAPAPPANKQNTQAGGTMFDNIVDMLNSDDNNNQQNPVNSSQQNDRIKERMIREVRPANSVNVHGNNNIKQSPILPSSVITPQENRNKPHEHNTDDHRREHHQEHHHEHRHEHASSRTDIREDNQVLIEDVIECDVPECNNDVYLNNKCYSHYSTDY